MANYKPGFREILDKIDGFMDMVNDDVFDNTGDEIDGMYVLLSKIKLICVGILEVDND